MVVDVHQLELWVGINWKCWWAPLELWVALTGSGGGHKLELWVGTDWKCGWAPIGIVSGH